MVRSCVNTVYVFQERAGGSVGGGGRREEHDHIAVNISKKGYYMPLSCTTRTRNVTQVG